MLDQSLRIDGTIIFEAFSKSHLQHSAANPAAGGPRGINMLFTIDEIKEDFRNFKIIELDEKVSNHSEGLYHNGTSSVVRFVGQKVR